MNYGKHSTDDSINNTKINNKDIYEKNREAINKLNKHTDK